MRNLFLITISLLIMAACADKNNNIRLKDGRWRGEFSVQDQKIPFLFEVYGADTDTSSVVLINGDEQVKLTGITYKNDTVIIPIEAYDSEMRGIISGGKIEGLLIKHYIENDKGLPFEAYWNNEPRFATTGKLTDIALKGKWDIRFTNSEGQVNNNVGIFNQQDNGMITGSILTSTGDLRYLDGYLNETGFQLSAFSGLSPYLIDARFTEENHFEGSFYTPNGITKLIGTRNNEANLADPYGLTSLKKGYDSMNFTFPDIEGNSVSLSDPQYKGKVVIVSILGSWCPNCLDEMAYLSPWYKENQSRGVEIIGLAFERKDDPEYAKTVLSRLIKRYDVSYKILFTGKIGTNPFTEIEKINSYPTTIFIDKKGKVRKIHTGFNGPATGLFYEEFKTDFNKLVDELIAE